MRGVVLGVFAAAVFVVILDQVFKQRSVEVIFLREDALEAEVAQFVDEGAAKGVALGWVGDEFADPVEQGDLGAAIGFHRENFIVADSDVAQGIVKQFGEFRRGLAVPQVGDEVLGFQAGGVRPHLHLQHFQIVGAQAGDGLFPLVCLREVGSDFLGLISEFVIEKFIEKDLGDDLEFVAVVAQAIGGADGFYAVDQLTRALFKFLRYQRGAPVLLRLPSALSPSPSRGGR